MKKLMFGMFLLAGTTLGFATSTIPTVNKTALEKVSVNGKNYTIKSVTYDENGKCTVKATYNSNNGQSTGTITITAETCAKAAQAIAIILGIGGK